MVRLALKLAVAAAALAALWKFVPLHGRTLADRWSAAGDLSTFVERAWAEATGGDPRPARPQARSQKPGARPSESHSEADRRAVDRILSEHLAGER